MEKVSVILVNYNGDIDTIDCISSLEKVNYNNLEIIVVDNASAKQDELEKKISDKVVYIKSKDNLGFSGGNNLGINYALEHGADYIVLLNNDTIVDPNFICQLKETSESHPDAGIITGKIYYYDLPDHIWYAGGYMNLNHARIHHYHVKEKDDFIDNVRQVTFATGCLMMIPRAVVEKIGLLDEIYFMYSEDAEYCFRVMNNGFSIWYNPDSKIYHKVSSSSGGSGSKLSQYYRTRNEMYLVLHKAKHKILGCICCILRFIKRLIVGQFTIKCVFFGLKDCITSKMGNSKRQF